MQTQVRRVFLATVVCVLGSALVAPALAQDGAADPFPFLFTLEGEIEPDMMAEFSEAVGKIVEAHQQHDNGNMWSAYAPLTGGGSPMFRFFIPLQKIGDMDGWTPNPQILGEVHGPEAAGEIIDALGACWAPASSLLAFNPAVSNPNPDWSGGAPRFAYYLRVSVTSAMIREYFSLAQQMAQAHRTHEDGLHWVGYMNAIGGEGREIHYFIGMDKLGEMDAWPLNAQVMIDSLGAEAWQKLQKRFNEIASVHSEILVLSPPHSNLGALSNDDG